jgi:hypothetical protein
VSGSRAAYATFAFGQEQSVTALDLSGEGTQNVTKKLHDRMMAAVTNWQLTGGTDGVGRLDVTLEQPAQRVGLAISDTSLAIALADDDRSARPTRGPRRAGTMWVAGVIVAGTHTNEIFIENGRFHGEKIARDIASRLA